MKWKHMLVMNRGLWIVKNIEVATKDDYISIKCVTINNIIKVMIPSMPPFKIFDGWRKCCESSKFLIGAGSFECACVENDAMTNQIRSVIWNRLH